MQMGFFPPLIGRLKALLFYQDVGLQYQTYTADANF